MWVGKKAAEAVRPEISCERKEKKVYLHVYIFKCAYSKLEQFYSLIQIPRLKLMFIKLEGTKSVKIGSLLAVLNVGM